MNVRLELISVLDNFASRLSSINNIDNLIDTVKDILEEVIEVDYSGLYLFDQESGSLRLYYAKGFTEVERSEAERTAHKRHPGLVFRSKKKIHIPDVSKDIDQSSWSSSRSFEINSRLYLPVMSLNEAVGTFGLASTKKNCFTEEHIAVLSFVCNLAGVVYSNINYLEKNKKAVVKERNLSEEITKTNNELKKTFTKLEKEHNKLTGTLNKLKETKDKFRMLSESTFEAIFFSEKGICTNQNATAEKLFGYTLDDAVGKNAIDWIHPEYHKKVIDNIKSGYDKPYEAVALRKDGSTFPCEIQGSMKVFKGNTFRVTALRDITSRKAVETAKKQSEERYRALINNAHESIISIDGNGKFILLNKTAAAYLGGVPEDFIGKTLWDAFPRVVANTRMANIKKIIQSGKPRTEELPISFHDKKNCFLTSTTPIKSDSGDMSVLIIATDITEQKLMAEALRENEEKYKIISQSTLDIISVLQKDGKINFINDSVMKILGWSPEEMTGKSFTKFVPLKSISKYLRALSDIFLHGELNNFVVQVYHKNGEPVDLEINGKLIKQDGVTMALGSARDISYRKKAEKEIEENHKKLEQYAERLELAMVASDAGLWDWNIKTGDVYFSERWSDMLGYKMSEIEPNISSWENIVHPDDMQLISKLLSDHLNGNSELYQSEHRMRTKSGEWKWILDTGKVTKRNKAGKALRAVGTHIDITRQKENEKKLIDNEKYLKTLNQFASSVLKHNTIDEIAKEVINLVIKDLGLEDCIIYLFDEDRKNIVQRAAYGPKQDKENTIKNPIIIPIGEGIVGTVAKTGIPEIIADASKDQRYILDDQFRYSELAVPIITDGEVIGVIDSEHHEKNFFTHKHLEMLETVAGLVSSRMKNAINQEKLLSAQASLKKLSTAVEQSPLAIIITDVDGTIEFVNPAYSEISGFSSKESIGTISDIFKTEPHPKVFHNEIWETIDKGKKWVGELKKNKKNGESFWALTSISPIKEAQGKITNFVAIQADITVNKKLENDLIKAKEYAEEANQAKSGFLANMSHEIRTPMNAVYGLIRLMQDTHLTTGQKSMMKKIRLSSDNLLTIINDILDFSKIESGQIKLEKLAFNIKEVTQRIVESMEYQASGKNLILELNFDDNIDCMLYGDPVRLHQVLLNLVNNAIKFTAQGKVSVTCKLINKTEKVNRIHFEVKDTGIGIEEDNIDKVFKIFEQEDDSTTRRYGGTGLGLAICSELVGLMGSKINVKSKKDEGSVFCFTIDLEVSDKKLTVQQITTPKINPAALKGKNILLVEDNKYNQYIAETILKKWSADVVCADNGQQAIEILQQDNFDLILMDKQMPVLDGLETTLIIRNDIKSDVPIIALTANVVKGIIDECMAAGMNGYLAKPFEPEDLYVKIMELLSIPVQYETTSDKSSASQLTSSDEPATLHDLIKLEKILGGNKKQLEKMILKFLEITPGYVEELNKCFNNNDIEGLERTAHKIKASIDLVANKNLRTNIRLIHDYSKEKKNIEKLPKMIDHFIENYSTLVSQLKQSFN